MQQKTDLKFPEDLAELFHQGREQVQQTRLSNVEALLREYTRLTVIQSVQQARMKLTTRQDTSDLEALRGQFSEILRLQGSRQCLAATLLASPTAKQRVREGDKNVKLRDLQKLMEGHLDKSVPEIAQFVAKQGEDPKLIVQRLWRTSQDMAAEGVVAYGADPMEELAMPKQPIRRPSLQFRMH